MPCCDKNHPCAPTSMCTKIGKVVIGAMFAVGVAAPVLFAVALATKAESPTAAHEPHSPPRGWPHQGIVGTYDRAALQRGFQVYKNVCSACHSLKLVSYRDLTDLGFNEAEVKAIAADYQVADEPDDNGDIKMRKARPSDPFVAPFTNDKAARAANGGALPPDLSLVVKARHDHEDYVYSLLTGFGLTPPAEEKIATGMNYNPYFAGHQIAMPPPLSDGTVTYADGTKATVPQMAEDVVSFLSWASEPKLEDRKETGIKVVLFLSVFAVVLYRIKKKIWSKLH